VGTEPNEWNDIKADVNAWTVLAESVGRVHRGFKEEVDTLWPLMEAALAENNKTTWFTGHSLGAAMAAICAGRCMLSKIESNPGRAVHLRRPARRHPALRQSLPIPGILPLG
jgi:triacylglycerol lipase